MNSINQDNHTIMTEKTSHTQNTEQTYLSSTTNGASMSVDATAQYKEVLKQPLSITVPYNLQPTEILAQRFTCWKAIIKAVLAYLQETCSIQDEIVRQQIRLSHAINFPYQNMLPTATALSEKKGTDVPGINKEKTKIASKNESVMMAKLFAPSGSNSVADLPQVLAEYHNSMIHAAQHASRELNNTIIPRLVDLRRDLQVKIKEIKELESDFSNNLDSQLNNTKKELQQYSQSLEHAKYSTTNKLDPYLCKLTLDRSIKRQLHEENFLHEAFANLQTSGGELEKVIIHEIQNALTQYAKLMGQEAQLVFDTLISKLDSGFLNIDPTMEWFYFTEASLNKDCFIASDLPMRHFSKISYKSQFDPLANELISGFLEKRSKFLKSYTRGFYLLTPTFLHEFKTGDRKKDVNPIMSLSLNDCTVAEHSKKGSSEYKFVLHAKQNGLIHRGQNWVFRCDSYETMYKWFDIMKKLTTTTDPKLRSKLVCDYLNLDPETGKSLNPSMKKAASQQVSTSQRSVISSDSKAVSKSAKNSLMMAAGSLDGAKTSNSAVLPPNPSTPLQNFHRVSIDDSLITPDNHHHETMSDMSASMGGYGDHPYGGNSEYDDSIVMNGYTNKWD